MGNSIINWIDQWLNDRRQRVVVDGEVSSWTPVLSGVPQGSVPGAIQYFDDGLSKCVTPVSDPLPKTNYSVPLFSSPTVKAKGKLQLMKSDCNFSRGYM